MACLSKEEKVMSEEKNTPKTETDCDSGSCGADFLGGLFNLMNQIEANKEKEKENNEA